MRQRRAADNRDRGLQFSQLAREPFDSLRRNAGQLLDARGREIGEAAAPSFDCRAGASGIARTQSIGDDHMRQAKREHPFGDRKSVV